MSTGKTDRISGDPGSDQRGPDGKAEIRYLPEKKKFAGKTYTWMAPYSPGTPKRVLDEAKGVLRRGNCSARTVKTKKGYTYLYIAKK